MIVLPIKLRKPHLVLLCFLAISFHGMGYAKKRFDGELSVMHLPDGLPEDSLKKRASFQPEARWYDESGKLINAHGGGLLYDKKTYYWFGEKRGAKASEGVNVYSSRDLYNWKYEGVALAKSTDPTSEIATTGLMERPKVIYNNKTKKYVMWFHLELPGKGYSAARVGIAVSDKVTGPYKYLHSFRPNGHMSRDMTLFVDEDGSAYHIYSARDNYDLRIVKLSDDFLSATRKDTLLFSEHREAPALFKYKGNYYLITSGCTGWAPNRASLHTSKSLFGPWQMVGDPMKGVLAEKTFDGQSTYILPVQGKKDAFIFMADRWNPKNLTDSRYLWLPITFENNSPVIEWTEEWNLTTGWNPLPAAQQEVKSIIHKVNSYWQTSNPIHGRAFWDNAAYHTGNMEAYFLFGEEAYRRYSQAWAEHNEWKGAKSTDKSTWKYSYGETDDYVLFGDWQICFQTYIDLYTLKHDSIRIARAKEVMEYEMSTSKSDYWWWADGLYMVMPVMTKLYKETGNKQYLDKLYEYFIYANSIMYDAEAKLYYRDAKYIYPKHKSVNGHKDFWARGDGWVFAALAKVLKDLPANDPHRQEYITKYKGMADAISKCQQPEGYWTRSLLDPAHAPGPETSGTAFFTYGFLWGINNGYLDEKTYLPVVQKSWQYLSTFALQSDGKIGYVQPIGEKAIPGQVVDKNSTSNFGVGAFLLAGCEMYRYLNRKNSK
ncbi:glycoside hydrolase family 88 protein [Xanthocytophaga flava]|uniref:glycoside hydrolase family 88 protein n=1 Tax=Xanthocytophaga flava TaxID=3048013 RepID=UPI0028D62A83|nr:glycoside hydrolase family 88 protein [Xanthocytophaga flavus]